MIRGKLYTIAAPSGAGKTSLVRALIGCVPDILVSVSHTTRPKRAAEVDGEDYFFVETKTFADLLIQQAFLEHAIVFGESYGTSKAWVETTLSQGIDVILEIDWQGAAQIKSLMPEAIGIFILPPSLVVLEKRLYERNQDAPRVIEARMAQAKTEISHHAESDYLILNENFDDALQKLQTIVEAERCRTERQRHLQAELIRQLR